MEKLLNLILPAYFLKKRAYFTIWLKMQSWFRWWIFLNFVYLRTCQLWIVMNGRCFDRMLGCINMNRIFEQETILIINKWSIYLFVSHPTLLVQLLNAYSSRMRVFYILSNCPRRKPKIYGYTSIEENKQNKFSL